MNQRSGVSVVLVLDDGGVWDGLYIDGQCVAQDATLYAYDALERLRDKCGLDIEILDVKMPRKARRLPDELSKVREWKI